MIFDPDARCEDVYWDIICQWHLSIVVEILALLTVIGIVIIWIAIIFLANKEFRLTLDFTPIVLYGLLKVNVDREHSLHGKVAVAPRSPVGYNAHADRGSVATVAVAPVLPSAIMRA